MNITPYDTTRGKRWRVRYRKPDGRQTDKRGFTTKRDATEWAARNNVTITSGQWIDPRLSKVTVAELGDAWIKRQTHLKPSTLRGQQIAWNKHVQPVWGATPIGKVRYTDIQTWVAGQTQSATVIIRNYGVLSAVLEDAVRDRIILANPAAGVKLPRKVHKPKRYLTAEQLHALARAAGTHGTLVLTLGYLGLRWGEAAGLRVKDFNPLHKRLTIESNAVTVGGVVEVGTPKTHRARSIAVPASLSELLIEQCAGRGPEDLVFPGPKGHMRTVNANGVRSWWKTAAKKIGEPDLTPHELRHTAASIAISAGANVKAIQRMLGHASASVTLDIYAGLFDDDLDSVASALDICMRANAATEQQDTSEPPAAVRAQSD